MLPRGEMIDILGKTQSDFHTAATGNYFKTYVYDVSLAEKQALENDPLLGLPRNNDRDTLGSVLGLPSHDGSATVPLDLAHFGFWLVNALGLPSTSGAPSDYTHVFNSGAAAIPYRTIEIKVPTTGSAIYLQHVGVVVNRFSLDLARANNYQRVRLDLLGKKENKLGTTSGGGTPAAPWTLDRILNTHGVLKIDTVAAELMSISAVYDNKLKGLEFVGDNYVNGYDSDEEASFTGSMRVRFKTFDHYDRAVASTPAALEFLWSKSASRQLSLAAPVARFERVGVMINGPGGIEQTFNFRAEQSAAAPMLAATLKNAVASYS